MEIVLAGVFGFGIVFRLIPTIVKIAQSKKLYEEPGGRRVHMYNTPNLGGVGIFFAILAFYISYLELTGIVIVPFLLPSMLIIFLIGVKDDILVTAPRVKFLGQIFAAALIVIAGDVRFTHFYGLINLDMGYWLSCFLSVLFLLLIINGFNLIDGIDGLAASNAIFSFIAFTIWFYINDDKPMSLLGVCIIGSLIAFLYYNFQTGDKKIFMGDTGSLILGLIVGVFAIKLLESNYILDDSAFKIPASTAVVLALLILPICDTIRVFFNRIANKKSPFSPDNTHVHHRLLTLGFTHIQIVCILLSCNALIVVMSLLLSCLDRLICTTIILIISFSLLILPSLFIRKRMVEVSHQNSAA